MPHGRFHSPCQADGGRSLTVFDLRGLAQGPSSDPPPSLSGGGAPPERGEGRGVMLGEGNPFIRPYKAEGTPSPGRGVPAQQLAGSGQAVSPPPPQDLPMDPYSKTRDGWVRGRHPPPAAVLAAEDWN